ncbi:MAG TPA: hypothetical protein VIJ01_11630 [Candidatus Angelobacter sp.]
MIGINSLPAVENCRWNNCHAVPHDSFTQKESGCSKFLKFSIQLEGHGNRSRTSGTENAGEDICPKVSLDFIGCFDLRRHISWANGGKVALYQRSHDQTAGAGIVRKG